MSANNCKVEVFARVTGFFRPVQSWNEGKTAEFKDRKKYNMKEAEAGSENDNSRTAKSVTC